MMSSSGIIWDLIFEDTSQGGDSGAGHVTKEHFSSTKRVWDLRSGSWDDVQIQDLGLEVKNFSLEESQEGGLPIVPRLILNTQINDMRMLLKLCENS